MWTNVLFGIILLLLVVELGVIYYFVKYQSFFLTQIRSMKGVEVKSLDIGNHAPLFRTFDEGGNKVVLKELFGEKKTFLLFIKTTCPICKSLLPNLQDIQNHYDLNFLLINSDNTDDDHEIVEVLSDKITYIRAPQIVESYFLSQYPYAMLIDTNGKIELHNRLQSVNSLRNMLINEKAVAS